MLIVPSTGAIIEGRWIYGDFLCEWTIYVSYVFYFMNLYLVVALNAR